jgi:hypothetical protein
MIDELKLTVLKARLAGVGVLVCRRGDVESSVAVRKSDINFLRHHADIRTAFFEQVLLLRGPTVHNDLFRASNPV